VIGTRKANILGYYCGYKIQNGVYQIMFSSAKDSREIDTEALLTCGDNFLFTHSLSVYDGKRIESPGDALAFFEKNLSPFAIVELLRGGENGCQESYLGYAIKEVGIRLSNLAHTLYLDGTHDTWFQPGYLPRKKWTDPKSRFKVEDTKVIRLLEDVIWDWRNPPVQK
jgi:hypothetical protein